MSTPSWYLPLSARIGGLGRLHEIREESLAMRHWACLAIGDEPPKTVAKNGKSPNTTAYSTT